ncbi:Cation/H(+) antiporter like [Quillaja saponaria]|nr:Cation/H(+) antiporter like [Quillaja saponaria]
MDPSILKKTGSTAALIGTMSFVLPYALSGVTFYTLNRIMTLDKSVQQCLPFVISINSMSSFPVIAQLLSDLNILNSEVGRLATYTSMINDTFSWLLYTLAVTASVAMRGLHWITVLSSLSIPVFLIIIVYILRPVILWLTRSTQVGQPMKDHHFISIIVISLGCGLCTEILGQHAGFGSLLLGIALPDGPPLGSSLINKLDAVTSSLLLPIVFAICGLRTDLISAIRGKSSGIIECIIIISYIGKFTGTLLPALYCSIPFKDALSLALIMCCKGIIEVSRYNLLMDSKILDDQSFALLLITMIIVTGVARPLIEYLYDPSKRYRVSGRRTILHLGTNFQLRVLACVHSEDNVPSIMKLLEASNGTRFNPIYVFVLHLMELTGRASAIFGPHHQLNKLTSTATHTDHIVNAFRRYEQYHQGDFVTQHFIAVAPYRSMHDDICTLALDKRITIVIVPFHKHKIIDGTTGSVCLSIRTVNCNVLRKAPCSVGVLIDRDQVIANNQFLSKGQSAYRIGVLFFGSADDWEALAYSRRMAEHSLTSLTVIYFRHGKDTIEKGKTSESEYIYMFIASSIGHGKFSFREEIVKDGVGTIRAIRSLEDAFDLFLVGKHHDPYLPLLAGLNSEWNEYPELGVIGDLLASADFKFSVLIVQQQPQDNCVQGPGILEGVKNLTISTCKPSSRVHPDNSVEEDFTPVHASDGTLDFKSFP